MTLSALGARRPTLPQSGNYWVAPGAHVIGDVVLGEDVSIWFNAVLRGDNEPITLGAGSNVQECAALHTDPGCPLTTGQNCTIGHGAVVHGCILGDNVLVGMGATVLNRARIGDNCLIGAHALITEDKEFPPGSLIVGAPAKAVRQLDAETIAGLRHSAERYINNYKRFRADLEILSEG